MILRKYRIISLRSSNSNKSFHKIFFVTVNDIMIIMISPSVASLPLPLNSDPDLGHSLSFPLLQTEGLAIEQFLEIWENNSGPCTCCFLCLKCFSPRYVVCSRVSSRNNFSVTPALTTLGTGATPCLLRTPPLPYCVPNPGIYHCVLCFHTLTWCMSALPL